MQYTDNEAALIGGLISNYFLRPAVSAALKDSYIHVLEHLHAGRVSAADLKQIQKALTFLILTNPMQEQFFVLLQFEIRAILVRMKLMAIRPH